MAKRKVVVDGKNFNSLKEASLFYSIDYMKVRRRLRSGWSIEESLGLIKRNLTLKEIVVGGVNYGSVSDACRAYNLNYATVSYRLSNGWSVDEAFGLVDRSLKASNSKEIVIDSVVYSSFSEACRMYGIQRSTAQKRIKDGWSLEEVFECENRESLSIEIDGKFFNILKDACDYLGISYNTYKYRRYSGWSVEEALELVPRCINGIIGKKNWNIKNEDLKIISVLKNDFYKCEESGKVRYYSYNELIRKFKEYIKDEKR